MPEEPMKPTTDDAAPRSDCPICGKSISEDVPTYPFCCDRCRKIDLGRWLDESYTISRPIEQSDLEEE